MRWFGIFAAALVIGAGVDWLLPSPIGTLLYMAIVLVSGMALIAVPELRPSTLRWLLGHWL